MHEHRIPALKIPTGRIETLTDGIFAIAMTLLVLSIEVPTLTGTVTPSVFSAYVTSILPQIFIYVIGFILLAVFWMNHHLFYIIKHTNTALLWINILWLMSIAIVPFSTSIIGKYGQFQLAQLIFDVNMLIIGLLWYTNWHYAWKKGFVAEKVRPYADRIRRSNLALPVLAIIAIMASFISPAGSFLVFVLVPVIFTLYTVARRVRERRSPDR
ncbi:MAG: TMEM175 family protein [Halobacteriota archaeon]